MVLETVKKLVSKDRFCKLKDFTRKMHSTFGNTYPLISFNTCESVVLYIILLEVDCKLSRFRKMARRSKVVSSRRLKSTDTANDIDETHVITKNIKSRLENNILMHIAQGLEESALNSTPETQI